jgi:hypothetical protein
VTAQVVALSTRVDSERGAVVKELEDATAIARSAPGRVVACAVAIISLDDDGLHHVHTNTEGECYHTLALMGAVQVLAADLAGNLVKCPAVEPPPAPEPEVDP